MQLDLRLAGIKTQQVSLPALQLAAALYFAEGSAAAPTEPARGMSVHCVDASGTEVAGSLCDGNQKRGTYFFATRDVIDSTDKLARRGVGLPETGDLEKRTTASRKKHGVIFPWGTKPGGGNHGS
ncbi:hypothetical protein RB601_008368 [Gaeumannomyces tritici]